MPRRAGGHQLSASTTCPRTADEIAFWSSQRELDMPRDIAQRAHFNSIQQKIAPNRKDLATWYDLHDLDDYVTFGGQP